MYEVILPRFIQGSSYNIYASSRIFFRYLIPCPLVMTFTHGGSQTFTLFEATHPMIFTLGRDSKDGNMPDPLCI